MSLMLDRIGILKLIGDRSPVALYAEPGGEDLVLSYKNTDSTAYLIFSGKGSEQNSFLRKFQETFKNDFDDSIMHPKRSALGVDAFEMAIFDNRKKQT